MNGAPARDALLDKILTQELGKRVTNWLQPGQSFALFIFDVGEPGGNDGTVTYLSNGNREDVLALLEKWLEQKRVTIPVAPNA